MLDLMYKLMEYRSQEIHHRLGKIGAATSMLHVDVLLLIYHFAKIAMGNILEIGPYIGGSTIAAAFGVREGGTPEKIISVEGEGRLKHPMLHRRNSLHDPN